MMERRRYGGRRPTPRRPGGNVYHPGWRPAGWTGRRYHLGDNKEVFDAVLCALYRALETFELRNETNRQFTVFTDSMAAISRPATDNTGPGQRFAAAMIEVGERIQRRGNSVTIRWAPTHEGAEGNEVVDACVMAAVDGCCRTQLPPGVYSHDEGHNRSPHPENRHVDLRARQTNRRNRLPKGSKPRADLKKERRALAGRRCLLLFGHTSTGEYLADRMLELPSDRMCRISSIVRWWCGSWRDSEARAPQLKALWKNVGNACRWKYPEPRPLEHSSRMRWQPRLPSGRLRLGRWSR